MKEREITSMRGSVAPMLILLSVACSGSSMSADADDRRESLKKCFEERGSPAVFHCGLLIRQEEDSIKAAGKPVTTSKALGVLYTARAARHVQNRDVKPACQDIASAREFKIEDEFWVDLHAKMAAQLKC